MHYSLVELKGQCVLLMEVCFCGDTVDTKAMVHYTTLDCLAQ